MCEGCWSYKYINIRLMLYAAFPVVLLCCRVRRVFHWYFYKFCCWSGEGVKSVRADGSGRGEGYHGSTLNTLQLRMLRLGVVRDRSRCFCDVLWKQQAAAGSLQRYLQWIE